MPLEQFLQDLYQRPGFTQSDRRDRDQRLRAERQRLPVDDLKLSRALVAELGSPEIASLTARLRARGTAARPGDARRPVPGARRLLESDGAELVGAVDRSLNRSAPAG